MKTMVVVVVVVVENKELPVIRWSWIHHQLHHVLQAQMELTHSALPDSSQPPSPVLLQSWKLVPTPARLLLTGM